MILADLGELTWQTGVYVFVRTTRTAGRGPGEPGGFVSSGRALPDSFQADGALSPYAAHPIAEGIGRHPVKQKQTPRSKSSETQHATDLDRTAVSKQKTDGRAACETE